MYVITVNLQIKLKNNLRLEYKVQNKKKSIEHQNQIKFSPQITFAINNNKISILSILILQLKSKNK